ncbi:hypothetical protein [Streptomyces sp. Agncl-13]|uniref:hypothetical protein n=1 Tax=Streptomyces sp. Agncl-13 TaxID=3400628 RepID=UPI003A85AA20
MLLGPALEHLNWRIVLYAVLSLTVVRMLPVALALAGSGLRLPTVAYVRWFGPAEWYGRRHAKAAATTHDLREGPPVPEGPVRT